MPADAMKVERKVLMTNSPSHDVNTVSTQLSTMKQVPCRMRLQGPALEPKGGIGRSGQCNYLLNYYSIAGIQLLAMRAVTREKGLLSTSVSELLKDATMLVATLGDMLCAETQKAGD